MTKHTWQPNIHQEKFVEGLLEGMAIKKAAETAGCSRDTYYKVWRRNPKFTAYLEEKRREAASARIVKVDTALFDKAEQGDIAAARLVYEVFGGLKAHSVKIENKYEPQGKPGQKITMMLDAIAKKKEVKLNIVESSSEDGCIAASATS